MLNIKINVYKKTVSYYGGINLNFKTGVAFTAYLFSCLCN